MYRVSIEQFEGPLDLLLEIIEQKKLPLMQVRLAGIAEDFIRYSKTLTNRTPEELVAFLVVASRLALLKSRELVPTHPETDEEEGSIEELERRLALYQPFRRGAKALQELDKANLSYWEREAFATYDAIEYIPSSLSAETLQKSIRTLLANTTLPQRIPQAEVSTRISIEACIKQLETLLADTKEVDFSSFIEDQEKEKKVAHFVGMLEMVRAHGAQAAQKTPFGTITLSSAAYYGE